MTQSGVENYLGQTDPTRNLVGDVFPVYMSYPGAGDVFHPTTTHPDLQKGTHTDTSGNVCVPVLCKSYAYYPQSSHFRKELGQQRLWPSLLYNLIQMSFYSEDDNSGSEWWKKQKHRRYKWQINWSHLWSFIRNLCPLRLCLLLLRSCAAVLPWRSVCLDVVTLFHCVSWKSLLFPYQHGQDRASD